MELSNLLGQFKFTVNPSTILDNAWRDYLVKIREEDATSGCSGYYIEQALLWSKLGNEIVGN